jgi:hypothetical protein
MHAQPTTGTTTTCAARPTKITIRKISALTTVRWATSPGKRFAATETAPEARFERHDEKTLLNALIEHTRPPQGAPGKTEE